jgi:hypothetical protein
MASYSEKGRVQVTTSIMKFSTGYNDSSIDELMEKLNRFLFLF